MIGMRSLASILISLVNIAGSVPTKEQVVGKKEWSWNRSINHEDLLGKNMMLNQARTLYDEHEKNFCATSFMFENRDWEKAMWADAKVSGDPESVGCHNPYGVCACDEDLEDRIDSRYKSGRDYLKTVFGDGSVGDHWRTYPFIPDMGKAKAVFFSHAAEHYLNGDSFEEAVRKGFADFEKQDDIHWDLMPEDVAGRLKNWNSNGFIIHLRDDLEGALEAYRSADPLEADRGSSNPGEVLQEAKRRLDLVKEDKGLIDRYAKENGMPAGLLYYMMGEYTRKLRQNPESTQQKENQKQTHNYLDARALVVAAIPLLKDMKSNDVDTAFFADRGARPIGKAIQYLAREFDVDIGDVRYFKFASSNKVVEAYTRTDEFAQSYQGDVEAVRETVKHISRLRSSLKAAKKRPKNERRFKEASYIPELERLEGKLQEVYSQYHDRALELLGDGLTEKHGTLGERIRVYDDWVSRGGTRDTTVALMKSLGIDFTSKDFIPFLDTANNESGVAALASIESLRDASHIKWQDLVVWHDAPLEVGVEYGMDKGTKDASKMFRMERVREMYELEGPENTYYSDEEIIGIADEIMSGYQVLDKERTREVVAEVASGVYGILSDCNRGETLEGTKTRLNRFVTQQFYKRIQEGVDELASVVSKEKFRRYLEGKAKDNPLEAEVGNYLNKEVPAPLAA